MNPSQDDRATRTGGKKKTVLIVDDNPGSLGVVVSHLEKEGLRVVVAQDGEEGIKRAVHVHPDLILLDVLMPGMDGFETCRRLKALESTRDIPVIFVTGVTDTAGMVMGFRVGGVDYVTKPFQLEEVVARVTTQLRLRELTEELERKVRDQTVELRDANEALRLANECLRDADRRKDEFLAMLAHELRNPLTPIMSSTFMLDRTVSESEPARRAVTVIERQTKHLARLVDDLLDVMRFARGKIELRRERLDLRDVVRRSGEDFRVMMEARGIELTIETPEQELWVDGDAVRLGQMIGNLLQNAQKFTDPGGRVTLTLAPVSGEPAALIRVCDTGAGIEPDLLKHVFEPFVQGERSLARTTGGLGLGLALVKTLAELHGGSVSAASLGPTRGAEFIVRLPVLGEAPAQVGGEPIELPHATTHHVLVVDDNQDIAEGLADVVRTLGHACDVAYDGPSALTAVRATHPDVVLCDLGLPGMSGFEVAKALREEEGGGGIRLVAISGYTQPADVKRAVASGFDAHVAKPLEAGDIARLLN